MSVEKPIEPSTVMQFQTEKLRRTIQECQDLDTLRGIAMQLLRLHEKKSAIAEWATKKGVDAECRALVAEMGNNNKLANTFQIIRTDGQSDEIAGRYFSSYDEAHTVLERYYADLSCCDEDEREYYDIVEVNS